MRIFALSLVLCCFVSLSPAAAQTVRLSPKTPAATDGLDQVLARYAKSTGFDYAGLGKDESAKQKLAEYLKWLETMPESAPLADWLNAYNALVLSSVMAKLPIASVMEHKGFFKTERHKLAGKARTLDEIENEIIRPRFHDARVHFALNCAARSCPTLHGRAFRSEGLDATLDRLTRAALKDPQHLRLTDRGLTLSAILSWFEEDFVRDSGSVRAFVRKYVEAQVAARITDDLPIVQREYDWSLNRAR